MGDQTEQRIIAAGVAIIIVQAIHILFLSSPQMTTLLVATVAAMAYPDYYFFTVSMDDNNESSQKKEEPSTIMTHSQAPFWNEWFSIPTTSKTNVKKIKKPSLVPASNFHYYQQSDGNKKWYRTGKSFFQRKSSSVKQVEPNWKLWRKTNKSKRT